MCGTFYSTKLRDISCFILQGMPQIILQITIKTKKNYVSIATQSEKISISEFTSHNVKLNLPAHKLPQKKREIPLKRNAFPKHKIQPPPLSNTETPLKTTSQSSQYSRSSSLDKKDGPLSGNGKPGPDSKGSRDSTPSTSHDYRPPSPLSKKVIVATLMTATGTKIYGLRHLLIETMTYEIIKWNLNGFKSKSSELKLIAGLHKPSVLALQETNLRKEHFLQFRDFHAIRKEIVNTNRSSGGVAILVKQDLVYEEVDLITNLEAVAIKMYLKDRRVTIFNLYLASSAVVTEKELEELLTQLPQPVLIVGDLTPKRLNGVHITTDKEVE
ncbi:hypothetical protein GWI33_021080 [Rhynchophorus ferrugineus]|uniref:Endonuclease/exonuclease/phosphatase domain-containing protein n=1 Tax=Rhynchophorus ferrugineus TaxID=354439 RepID=A0A834HT84_RHYFE|nr:hypothetical protein GWI33_021080 [Rhynchophorus ferrugineus]